MTMPLGLSPNGKVLFPSAVTTSAMTKFQVPMSCSRRLLAACACAALDASPNPRATRTRIILKVHLPCEKQSRHARLCWAPCRRATLASYDSIRCQSNRVGAARTAPLGPLPDPHRTAMNERVAPALPSSADRKPVTDLRAWLDVLAG